MFPSSLAVKYARAFLIVFKDAVSDTLIDDVDRILEQLHDIENITSSLKVLSYEGSINSGAFEFFLRYFKIGKPLDKLIGLLSHHKRLYMVQEVLQAVKNLYQKDNGIVSCTMTSACELDDEQKRIFEKFASRHLGNRVRTVWRIDRNLIAGIGIKTDDFLWEDSVAKRLRAARNQATRKYHGY